MERKETGRGWCAGRGHGGKDSSAEKPGSGSNKVGVRVGSDLDLLPLSCFLRHGCLLCPEFFYLNVSG